MPLHSPSSNSWQLPVEPHPAPAHVSQRVVRTGGTLQCPSRSRHVLQAAWRTDEIRRRQPTPLDEMLLGLEYVKAMFDMLPKFARRIDSLLESIGQPKLPLDTVIVTFGSWMGGDRDGNPNVKPQTTRDVVITSRLAACNLYMDLVSVRRPAAAIPLSIRTHACVELACPRHPPPSPMPML